MGREEVREVLLGGPGQRCEGPGVTLQGPLKAAAIHQDGAPRADRQGDGELSGGNRA